MPVRPALIDALGSQETGGEADPDRAVSSRGAVGRYQIEPATARAYGFDPARLHEKAYGRTAATTILGKLIDQHNGNEREGLKSYYGRGTPPKGHPTADAYADRVLKMAAPATLSDKDFAEAPKTLTDADMAGSVYEPTGQRLKRQGKTAAELAVGVALPAAASYFTGGASIPVQIGAQALAGAAQPYAEAGVEKAFGGSPLMPGWKDAARSAAFTAGAAMIGEGIAGKAGTGAAAGAEIKALPKEAQTVGNLRQALRNRDFWKAHGLTDDQIDAAVKTPEIQTDLAKQIAAGQQYRGAFQTVIDETRKTFKARYEPLIPKDVKVDSVPIGQAFEGAAQAGGEHEITPSLRSFLQRKGLELTRAGETTGPSVGGVPWKALPEKLKEQIRAQGGKQGIATPTSDLGIQGLRDLRTELRENISASATNLDKKVASQLNDQITKAIDEHLTPEQRGAMKALDEEYGRFQEVIKKLDPRSEKYGDDVANALMDPMVKNPNDAANFIRLAKAAEAARPGEVMPQLRAAMLDKFVNEARVGNRPMDEMRALQKIQETWGGQKGTQAVLSQVFGKDSPIASPATMARVLGVLQTSDRIAADASQGLMKQAGMFLRSPEFLMRLALSYGVYRAIAGGTGSPWKDISDPGKMLPPLMAFWLSGKMARFALGAADTRIQHAYVNFLLNPSDARVVQKWAAVAGGSAGALTSLPSEQPTSE